MYNYVLKCLDLERQISVRSTREELIKRGVLKEVEETPPPVAPVPTIPEESENGRITSFKVHHFTV